MRTQIVTAEDLRLTKVSAVIAEALESHSYGPMAKRFPGYRHADSLTPIDPETREKELHDREVPRSDAERRVMELRQEISELETQLAAGIVQDSPAIRERIGRDRQLLSRLTAVPNFADQIGRIP